MNNSILYNRGQHRIGYPDFFGTRYPENVVIAHRGLAYMNLVSLQLIL